MSFATPPRLSDPFLAFVQNQGMIAPDQLHVLHREQMLHGASGFSLLKALGILSEGHLQHLLSAFYNCPVCRRADLVPDPALLGHLPLALARHHRILPLKVEEGRLIVALERPHDLQALDQIRKTFPHVIPVPHLALEGEILPAIEAAYAATPPLDTLIAALDGQAGGPQDGHHPIIALADAIIDTAVHQRASDIHFEPGDFFVMTRIRIDGTLQPLATFHKDHWGEILVHLKILARMNISETRRPQGGRFSKTVRGREVDFRASCHPTLAGENLVIRILDKARALLPLEDLGLTPHHKALLEGMMQAPEGLIIVTGPTGAGKTTTLYSVLGTRATPNLNIMTLEDPIEYQLPLIRQTEVHETIGLTFEAGVRSILRQDPDVILIGETRDAGTAGMALRAAMTGHQVYTTLHTNDAIGAIARLGELGVPRTLLSGHIVGIVAQRLVRKLCPLCQKPTKATAEEAALLHAPPGTEIWQAQGCPQCFTSGYLGRTGIFEMLPISPALNAAIHQGSSPKDLLRLARREGFQPLAHHARTLVLEGVTSLPEILRAVTLGEEEAIL